MAKLSHNKNRVREIAVLVETDSSWGRSVVQGVANFSDNRGPWNLLIDPRDYSRRWALPDRWRGDGIIARISTPVQLEEIVKTGLPTVNIDDVFVGSTRMGQVLTDEQQRARLAYSHFRERGLEKFAYYAPPSHEYSISRQHHFVQVLEQEGFSCHVYLPGYRVSRRISRDEQHKRVLRWLLGLPRPVAVLAVNAARARELAEVCSIEGIPIPDEVAILAGDTDDLLCELSSPKLSSIDVCSQKIGYEAAAMLSSMLGGKAPPDSATLVPPLRVIAKQSTDALAIDDPLIIRAMRFIETHAFQGIVVEDILREVPVSRRYLEIQFKRLFGRLPAEEIRHRRLERGRELLSQTELPIESIATMCGYAGSTQFGVAFRKRYGQTPLTFRKQLHES